MTFWGHITDPPRLVYFDFKVDVRRWMSGLGCLLTEVESPIHPMLPTALRIPSNWGSFIKLESLLNKSTAATTFSRPSRSIDSVYNTEFEEAASPPRSYLTQILLRLGA